MTQTPVYYSDAYANSRAAFDTTRKARWIADSLRTFPITGARLVAPQPVGCADLRRAHDDDYIDAVRTGEPAQLAESSGLGWDARTWAAVTASTGGVLDAAKHALRTNQNAGTLSSGLHHADRRGGAGFCTFNGLAVAAHWLAPAQVLIIDLDAHPGDGTADIIAPWTWVTQLDIAVASWTYRVKRGSTLDIVREAATYLDVLDARLSAAKGYDIVLYNAGVDPHEGCAIGGLAGITADVLAERDRRVFTWARAARIPVAFTLAGGYVGLNLSQRALVDLHRQTIRAAVQRGDN